MFTRTLHSFILIIALFFTACTSNEDSSSEKFLSQKGEETTTSTEVPELLERSEAIRYEKEWEAIQNEYAKQLKLISQGGNANEAKLRMAQLFTMEARVTGEHGHYYPGALKLLNEILKTEELATDVEFMTLSTKAGVQLSQHDFSDALTTGKTAVAMNPYNAQIYGVLVDASVELGQYEKAVEFADQMMSIRPDLRSYSRVSYLREIHGMPEASIEAMEMAISAGAPGSEEAAWTRLQLGELYERYGNVEEARLAYEIILIERPNYPFAIAALANLDMKQGDFEAAEKKLTEACAIIPEFGFYEQLAALYQKTDREEEAQKKIEEVLVMLEDDVTHGHNMNLEYANLYSNLVGDQDKALVFALNEYEKRPENITVNLVLADIYHAKGETNLAAEHLTKASVTNSADPELLALAAELKRI